MSDAIAVQSIVEYCRVLLLSMKCCMHMYNMLFIRAPPTRRTYLIVVYSVAIKDGAFS